MLNNFKLLQEKLIRNLMLHFEDFWIKKVFLWLGGGLIQNLCYAPLITFKAISARTYFIKSIITLKKLVFNLFVVYENTTHYY